MNPPLTSAAGLQGPIHEHEVELRSARTRFREAGQGFPLVLIHGLMGYSFSWRKNIAALAQHFRVLALDLAGCGRSGELRAGRYGVSFWSQQVEEFLEALQLPCVHLAGTSAGGAVAVDLASRCPNRVARMVLVAPVNPFSRRVVFLSRIFRSSPLPAPVLRALLRRAPQWAPGLFRHRYYADPARLTPETIPGYLAGMQGEVTVRLLQQALRGWQPGPMQSQLCALKAPTLLVWGEKDKLVPFFCVPRLLKVIPKAALQTMPGAGHFCFEEFPEEFNEGVLRFLEASPPSRGMAPTAALG